MKELSIKEKAKAYDKALEAIKSLQEVNPSDEGIQNWVNENFPELKESEDERTRKEILKHFVERRNLVPTEIVLNRWIAWLEKQGEQKPDWSEEDEAMLDKVIKRLHKYSASDEEYLDKYYWLKEIKHSVQPKQEWSEEDKKIIDRIESEFLALHRGDYKNIDFNDVDSLSVLNWVRKIKSLCFQSRWKPSDEQMRTLEHYMHTLVCTKYKEILFGLYTDLKKLMEE